MTETISQNTATKIEVANAFFKSAMENELPVAFWRKPNEPAIHLITDLSGKANQVNEPIEELNSGFLVCPFESSSKQAYFIEADIHWKFPENELAESQEAKQFGTEKYEKRKAFFKSFNLFLKNPKKKTPSRFNSKTEPQDASQAFFESLVTKGIEEIKKGSFLKVVLSRRKTVEVSEEFSPVKAFLQLCEQHPTAFVSLVSTPKLGTWLGATPETLAHTDSKQVFRTIALAGTQAKDKFETLADATWRQKEIEEQALVSRYIINCFKQIRLREFDELGPRTVQAGNLIHLRTDFMVDMEAQRFPQLGSVMLELLHPTSAVCGMPKPDSAQFILAQEGYNRQLYSGFIGPVNIENDSHIFVNLRCMQLLENHVILYAGAGITQDSNPQKEWLETEMKMKAMRQIVK
jgi:isochorismate synthase